MKKIIFSFTLAGAVLMLALGFTPDTSAPAQTSEEIEPATFVPDKGHSKVGFKVRHLGIANVRGQFTDYDATVEIDPQDLAATKVSATIQTGSIDTGIERRDNHLKSDDFFNAEMYPTMTFVSKSVRNIDGPEFELVGDLTIRDVTQEVVLEVEFLGEGVQRGTRKIGLEAVGTINRFDYNLKWDALTEAGGLVVSENVEIILEMEMAEETDS